MQQINYKEPFVFKTPVLFLVFNRLDTTKKVFNKIRDAKPPRLYISSDGAREQKQNENEKVVEIRNFLIDNIDWNCEVKTLFNETNLGCKLAVSNAISWFFKNEEQGIILEDDCLPSNSFFFFCEEMLEKYKNDFRIWHISGNNFLNPNFKINQDYYFSKYVHVWGWATWANRWNTYDVLLNSLPLFIEQNQQKNIFFNKKIEQIWKNIFLNTYRNKIDTWDYQWVYTVLTNSGLSIIPKVNLVTNIGFGIDATHTFGDTVGISNIDSKELNFPIIHPVFLLQNTIADANASELFYKKNYFSKFFKKIKKLIR